MDETTPAATAADSADLPAGPPARILIVDNDRDHAEAIQETLDRAGYDTTLADSGPRGAKKIADDTYDLVITDLVMNDIDGMEILARARSLQTNCEVIVVTGHASVAIAVEAMQHGAYTFLEKPIATKQLRAVVAKAADKVRLKAEVLALNQRLDERYGFENIVSVSEKMTAVIDQVKRFADKDIGVLITGPTGAGKDLIAEAIHQNSPRKNKPFVALNCGAISSHLVESELFGHVKGAFTDAHADRVGKFEYANGGTLFLDEIGDMPLVTQIKLLRVLEEREITRIGANKPIKVNVRVLSATNVDLKKAIEENKFRKDLYYRLKGVSVDLPPLNDRRSDILPLAQRFSKLAAQTYDKTIRGISREVYDRLFSFDWDGNVRQLKSVVDAMVVLDDDGELNLDDLPPELADAPFETPVLEEGGDFLIGKTMDEIEAWAISETLKRSQGNREEAARILKIGARTLYRKLDKYRDEFPQYDLQ
ncbi:sigma-54-dependent transcriptional regulator [Lignipirellula cremea]|uniref:DNA-binding transcriptional response regulator n=1 Tax=Lignipirellula cremea TaxID=2528010 RepID=A0A518DV33_9BACT|nr:sigma-54 dependent transcriptional regulator [Lignipirellula cremea]QDU95693.1 DNA-binding transcriptional response regulator [Lignipirellula cremea]